MSQWLPPAQLRSLERGFRKRVETPIPTQIVSSGECYPPPQSRRQAQVEALMGEGAESYARRLGVHCHHYLRSPSGMAAAFLAMNQVYGELFQVDTTEAEDPAAARQRREDTRDQFIFDVHTHHVHEDYAWEGQLWLRDAARGNNQAQMPWNPELVEQELDLKYYKFDYYVKDMFFDSDTTLALLSTSPSVDPDKTLLTDRQLVATRDEVNRLAGTRRMFAHGVIWPSAPGYLELMETAATEVKVEAGRAIPSVTYWATSRLSTGRGASTTRKWRGRPMPRRVVWACATAAFTRAYCRSTIRRSPTGAMLISTTLAPPPRPGATGR